jgi:molecular chaperone GrpE
MSERRQVWETLSQLLKRVEQGVNGKPSDTVLKQLEDEVRKLGKAQFKANVLTEDQSTRLEQALEDVREEREKRAELREALIDERVAAAKNELLETILPALDGVEKAMSSGKRYLQVRDRAAHASNLTDEQAILVSPADRAMLTGWLDGLRLVRERLLAILEAGQVTPIPTVGHPFDPYLHVAVDTTSEGEAKSGTIVEEERRGYRTPDGVLRYAEVIVYRPESKTRENK